MLDKSQKIIEDHLTENTMDVEDTQINEMKTTLLQKTESAEKDSRKERLIQLQQYDRRQTYKEIVQVHSAADTAKRAYGRRYQSEEEDQSEKPSFAQDDSKLINNYTNKVSLQMKY